MPIRIQSGTERRNVDRATFFNVSSQFFKNFGVQLILSTLIIRNSLPFPGTGRSGVANQIKIEIFAIKTRLKIKLDSNLEKPSQCHDRRLQVKKLIFSGIGMIVRAKIVLYSNTMGAKDLFISCVVSIAQQEVSV